MEILSGVLAISPNPGDTRTRNLHKKLARKICRKFITVSCTKTNHRPITLHGSCHLTDSFCPVIELCSIACKKLVGLQKKTCTRLTDTRASLFLVEHDLHNSVWYKFLERVSPAWSWFSRLCCSNSDNCRHRSPDCSADEVHPTTTKRRTADRHWDTPVHVAVGHHSLRPVRWPVRSSDIWPQVHRSWQDRVHWHPWPMETVMDFSRKDFTARCTIFTVFCREHDRPKPACCLKQGTWVGFKIKTVQPSFPFFAFYIIMRLCLLGEGGRIKRYTPSVRPSTFTYLRFSRYVKAVETSNLVKI